MTNKEILQNAIKKAEMNGYKGHLKFLPFVSKKVNLEKLLLDICFINKDEIIYSKEFAKCFFGEQDKIYRINAWIYRLQEMSKMSDDIRYLKKFLDK